MDTLWPPIENKCFMENIFLFTGSEIQAYGYFSLCLQIFKRKQNKQPPPPLKSVLLLFKRNCTTVLSWKFLRVLVLQWTPVMSITMCKKSVRLPCGWRWSRAVHLCIVRCQETCLRTEVKPSPVWLRWLGTKSLPVRFLGKAHAQFVGSIPDPQ